MRYSLFLKHIVSWFFYHAGVVRNLSGSKDNSIILGYHHVLPVNDEKIRFIQPGMYVTTKTFEKHMRYLAINYDIISLQDLIKAQDFRKMKNKCIITFDDGWADNYRYAYPILKELGIPATVFVSTNMIGSEQWPWPDRICHHVHSVPSDVLADMYEIVKNFVGPEYNINRRLFSGSRYMLAERFVFCIKTLEDSRICELMDSIDTMISPALKSLDTESPWLTWKEIREMARNNISFGAHTQNHVILTRTSLTDARDEISCSKEKLSYELDRDIEMFSYPNGNYNAEIVSLLNECGFKAAVTTSPGTIETSGSLFELNRYIVHNDVTSTIPMLACRINPRIPFF